MASADDYIRDLGLQPHPEGGWFRETYRAAEAIPGSGLPERFGAERSISTAIYFLLKRGNFSAFHRIRSDELWHFYAGQSLVIHIIEPEGHCWAVRLGADTAAGESFQALVPAGCWFAAEVTAGGEFALVGCTVAPGFDFADFELAQRENLIASYPAHRELITRLTRG